MRRRATGTDDQQEGMGMIRSIRLEWVLALALATPFIGACKDTVDSIAGAVGSPAPAAPIVPGQIGGSWGTRWGSQVCNLQLTQNGANVTGSYTTTGAAPGTVTGTFANNVLTGTWADQSGASGGLVLTFTPDSRSFTGTWGNGPSATNGGGWTGTR